MPMELRKKSCCILHFIFYNLQYYHRLLFYSAKALKKTMPIYGTQEKVPVYCISYFIVYSTTTENNFIVLKATRKTMPIYGTQKKRLLYIVFHIL